MSKNVLIIGASHAAAQCCVSLRQGGWGGGITIVGDEPILPYHRPPLSKDFLSGKKAVDEILIRPAASYAEAGIEVRVGERVGAINREAKTVLTDEGDTLSYDKLVLCTGARVRRLPVPGEDMPGVFYLRDAKDVLAIKDAAEKARSVVIIGGGYIGLEAAASLRQQGLDVVVLEAMPRILQRVTAEEMSDFYRRIHSEEGVTILEGVMASEVVKDGGSLCVKTSCDKSLSADMVIVGIGVIPNVELAEAAGLDIGNGIIVNEFAQTSDPDIYAAGDVTWHYNPIYGEHVRLESVPNATDQAKTVANHINGKPTPYNSLPWFWSDQYDLKLQIAGLSTDFDQIVLRGDPSEGRSFAAYYFKAGQFIAVDAVNAPRDFMFGKMVLTKGKSVDPTLIAQIGVPQKDAMI